VVRVDLSLAGASPVSDDSLNVSGSVSGSGSASAATPALDSFISSVERNGFNNLPKFEPPARGKGNALSVPPKYEPPASGQDSALAPSLSSLLAALATDPAASSTVGSRQLQSLKDFQAQLQALEALPLPADVRKSAKLGEAPPPNAQPPSPPVPTILSASLYGSAPPPRPALNLNQSLLPPDFKSPTESRLQASRADHALKEAMSRAELMLLQPTAGKKPAKRVVLNDKPSQVIVLAEHSNKWDDDSSDDDEILTQPKKPLQRPEQGSGFWA
jgi:hypothetical protein